MLRMCCTSSSVWLPVLLMNLCTLRCFNIPDESLSLALAFFFPEVYYLEALTPYGTFCQAESSFCKAKNDAPVGVLVEFVWRY